MSELRDVYSVYRGGGATVYPKKFAHGFVVLCFVVVTQSFIMNSHEVFIHIHQGCFAGTGAIVRLPQCQWSKPDGYGKISQCITTTKHSKAKTVCIFLGIYCRRRHSVQNDAHETGPWFNIKMSSYQYRKSHCGDKTVVRSSYHISTVEFPKLVRWYLRIQSAPRSSGVCSPRILYHIQVPCNLAISRSLFPRYSQ